MTEIDPSQTALIFKRLLQISALLPKVDGEISKNYNLSRKQMYLVYLVYSDDPGKPYRLADYARYLNISTSTLTRNVEKLEERKVMERTKNPDNRGIGLRLLSMGQLYALEIGNFLQNHFAGEETKIQKLGVDLS